MHGDGLTLFSDSDPITGGGDRWFQEDQGPELARRLVAFVGRARTR